LLLWFESRPRQIFGAIAASSLGLLGFGLYLQHGLGLNPCPMCIVQRYALLSIAIISLIATTLTRKGLQRMSAALLLIAAGFGAFVAARQSWLQWYPPEVVSCGRDFYGMIETFPLQRAIPMIFKGGGDCTAIDWTFLGGSIANWSFLCFSGIALLALLLIWRPTRK
jgi:disulfide bond formation protein DsbB